MPTNKSIQDLNNGAGFFTGTGPGPWMPNLAKSGGWIQGMLDSAGGSLTWTVEATNDINPSASSPVVGLGGSWTVTGANASDAGQHNTLAKWIRFNVSANTGNARFLHSHD